jgi:hypothetical protein
MLGYALRKVDATIPSATGLSPEDEVTLATPDPEVLDEEETLAVPAEASGVSTSSTTGGAVSATGGAVSATGGEGSTTGATKKWLVPLLAAVAVVVVVGVGAFVFWSGDDDGKDRASSHPPTAADNEGGGGADSCPAPRTPPVDDQADEAARCLAGQLDEWAAAGKMAIGQEVNLADDGWTQVLTSLAPADVRLVGFDLTELGYAAANGHDRVPDLVTLGEQGHVLTASWHPDNPWTGQGSWDLTDGNRLAELVAADGSGKAYDAFWGAWDQAVDALARLGEAGVPVIVRPLHEGNGQWFWWAGQDPAIYRQLYDALRERAEAAGAHNLLWAFAAAGRTYDGIQDPLDLLPDVDLAGIDTYDCEQPGTRDERLECGGGGDYSEDVVDLTSYAELAAAVPRTALTEVGPQFSYDGSWRPSVVTRSVAAQGLSPVYAMFWFDDQREGRPPMSKQISSLRGGREWLASCADALCDISGS